MANVELYFLWYVLKPLLWGLGSMLPTVLILSARRIPLRRRISWGVASFASGAIFIALALTSDSLLPRTGGLLSLYLTVAVLVLSIVAPWLVYTRFRHVRASVAP
jgi:hypothetical protein